MMPESKELRSRIMRAVKGRDTKPELFVRSKLHRAGYRFRLHRQTLPGRPDLVFPGRRKVIFVHGCFWHGHDCKRGARSPKNNAGYWRAKIDRNRARDERNREALRDSGWKVETVWECELGDIQWLKRLKRFLGRRGSDSGRHRSTVHAAHGGTGC